mmetsp:Transcript_37362/g.95529  ORF Transcript_37362/g.95529 Transcript_37362/m.95529 type:complete len:301 (+) Transcript_37362:261-1163(+)
MEHRERVLVRQRHRGPALGVRHQDALHEGLHRARRVRREGLILAVADELAQGVEGQSLLVKGAAQRGDLVQQAAEAPRVAAPVVRRAADALRRHVVRRAHHRLRHHRLGAEVARQAEVANLELPRRGHQDIGGLQVAVHHPPRVHVLQRVADLYKVHPDLLLRERLPHVLLPAAQQLLQVALLCPLQHDDQLILLNEGVDVLDYMRVLQRLQDLDLVDTVVAHLTVHDLEDLHLFEGHHPASLPVLGGPHLRKLPAAYEMVQLKSIEGSSKVGGGGDVRGEVASNCAVADGGPADGRGAR